MGKSALMVVASILKFFLKEIIRGFIFEFILSFLDIFTENCMAFFVY